MGLAGNDEITATGVNALIVGGLGNDELTGAAGAYLRGGDGNDLLTLSTASGGTLVGNGGDDTLQTRGKAYVVPGPGRDTVTPKNNTGPTTVVINDVCEVEQPGETLTGSIATTDVLITPVPLATLTGIYQVAVSGFEIVTEEKNSCLSECVTKPDCGPHGYCIEAPEPLKVACACEKGYEWNGSSCVCKPDCANKRCGDDATNNCGEECTNFCVHDGSPTSGYAGWWKFDEGSGDIAADSSGNGNTGVLGIGNAARKPAWVAGKSGGALRFDGVDDIVDCGNNATLNIRGPLTIEAWINPAADTVRGSRIVSKGNNPYLYELVFKDASYKNVPSWSFTFPSGGRWAYTQDTIPVDQWSHVALVYDLSVIRFYVNGVADQAYYNENQQFLDSLASRLYIGAKANC